MQPPREIPPPRHLSDNPAPPCNPLSSFPFKINPPPPQSPPPTSKPSVLTHPPPSLPPQHRRSEAHSMARVLPPRRLFGRRQFGARSVRGCFFWGGVLLLREFVFWGREEVASRQSYVRPGFAASSSHRVRPSPSPLLLLFQRRAPILCSLLFLLLTFSFPFSFPFSSLFQQLAFKASPTGLLPRS